jgi:murein DD-endopeptidase MepM/ murein hydrolase activator NlpD
MRDCKGTQPPGYLSMKRIKYYYNPQSLRYEKWITPFRVKLLRAFGFLAASLVTAGLIVAIAFKFIDSPKEKLMALENEALKQDYSMLRNRIGELEEKMAELENRDNFVYREIFESTPIPDSARAEKMAKEQEVIKVTRMGDNQLSASLVQTLNNLSARIAFQEKSYQDILGMVRNKEKLLAATPAIQPVANKDLKRVASGFGYRVDPVYKTVKLHEGLDFSAPQGTPIYATADGTVTVSGNQGNGYGNHVVIHHGYGYETLYGHMVRTKARRGQSVKRGELIGWVGSTGKSTGPHLHYEVHKNRRPVDPIYFFYNDLSPEQFDRILKLAASSNQSFD